MKKIKKIVSALLATVMICGSAAIGMSDIEPSVLGEIFTPKAEAAETSGTCGDNLTWTFDETTGTLTISGSGDMMDFHDASYAPWYEYLKQYKIKKIVIENGITSISDDAFMYDLSLESVSLPESLVSIGDYAFMGDINLKDVSLPQGIESLGTAAFYDCGFLNIYIPAGLSTIGESAFFSCDKLYEITVDSQNAAFFSDEFGVLYSQNILIQYPAGNKRTSYEIPNNVTKIGRGAFYGSQNLTSITFTSNIANIDNNAFGFCDNLKDVYFIGTEEQWNKININKIGNYNLTDATIHYTTHTHSYTSSVTTTPTCNKEGVITYTCDCGDIYTESIPTKTHTSSDWIIISNETCTQNGTKIKKCAICGETIQTESIPSTVHTPGEWETTTEATIEKEGLEIKKCIYCGKTLEEKVIPKLTKPETNKNIVSAPSQSTINYGDSIILHVDPAKIPTGGYVEWYPSNGNFGYTVSADGTTCTITPQKSGDTIFTATIYDAYGNAVSSDEQVMTSKAGFFQKIIAFFKKLFGLTKTYPDIFKF